MNDEVWTMNEMQFIVRHSLSSANRSGDLILSQRNMGSSPFESVVSKTMNDEVGTISETHLIVHRFYFIVALSLPSSNRQDARFSVGERGFKSLREL